MGLTIPQYDPLDGAAVLTEQEIYNAVDNALTLPVAVTQFAIWFDVTPARLATIKQQLDCWESLGIDHLPLRDYNNNVYYVDKVSMYYVYKVLTHAAAVRRMNVFAKQEELLNNFDYGTVDQRDIYWKEWVGLDSNLTSDINWRYNQTFAEVDSDWSHEDFTIGGTDNNEVSLASGSEWRTAFLNIPIHRPSYWEFDVANNVGTIYVGLANKHHKNTDRIGYGTDEHGYPTSYGVKITDGILTHLVSGGVETAANPNIDLFGSSVETAGRLSMWIDPTTPNLRYNEGGATATQQTWGSLPYTFSQIGEMYPAVTLYDSGNIANFRAGGPNSICDNYMPSSAYPYFEVNNFANGIYSLAYFNPQNNIITYSRFDPRSYGGVSLDSDGMIQPYRGQTAHYRKIKRVSSAYTVQLTDEIILVDASAGDVTITLPPKDTHGNMQFQIKKVNTTGGNVIVDGDGSETIDGATTQTLTGSLLPSITVLSDPRDGWYII